MMAGLTRGTRASAIAALGCTLGIVPHMALAISGLAALLHTYEWIYRGFTYVGVAYLLYMAWATIRERGALTLEADENATEKKASKVVLGGILANLTNPKLTIFFFAFLPQFVSNLDPAATTHMIQLSGIFMALTLGVFVLYGWFAASVRDKIITRPKVMTWIRRVFAGTFVGLGLSLAVANA